MIEKANMEIGSFIELEFPKEKEWYPESRGVARLNSGRAAITHACRVLGCSQLWLPYYQCEAVSGFLKKQGIGIDYYRIDKNFQIQTDDEMERALSSGRSAILIVNYYGIMGTDRLCEQAKPYPKVIIDNSQGFFSLPLKSEDGKTRMNVYSARKFVGVPDGAYVVGDGAEKHTETYERDVSSDTALFLLQRIEYGCEGKAYECRMKNEHRIEESDVLTMSKLTHTILDGIDYDMVKRKRQENFATAHKLFGGINLLDVKLYYDWTCVPMVYPLVLKDDSLLTRLLEARHYQGHWWSYLLETMPDTSFEYWLSRYMVPVTIDQRYGPEQLHLISEVVKSA